VPRDRVKSQKSRFEVILQLGGLALLAVILGGCGPELSKSDLGTVVFEVPKVAGADKPYAMPKLGPPDEKNEENSRGPMH
jgi:hypothetical protein